MGIGVSSILGKAKDERKFRADARFVLPETRIGVEFEFEGVRNNELPHDAPQAQLWEFHNDTSLRENGAEYVFRAPMFGTDAHTALEWMVDYANKEGWRTSIRTGYHVHLDVRDLEVPQLIGMLIIYSIVEPLLFRWVGDDRENNINCVPLYRADDSVLEAAGVIRSANRDAQHGTQSCAEVAKRAGRYAALNLNALEKFGSLEFRHMRQTLDFQRVVNWINMCMAIKEASLRVPSSDGAIVQQLEMQGPEQFSRFVFGQRLHNLLWDNRSADLIMDVGLATAVDLVTLGLSVRDGWHRRDYPQGENKGFLKYVESKKAPKEEPVRPLEVPVARQRRVEVRLPPAAAPRLVAEEAGAADLFEADMWAQMVRNARRLRGLQANDEVP